MKFKAGISGNPTGRPKGAKNLTTLQVKEILTGIIQQHLKPGQINRDLKELKPKDRLEILVKLATFIIPRPTETSLKFDFESLEPDKVEQIYSLIFDEHGNN